HPPHGGVDPVGARSGGLRQAASYSHTNKSGGLSGHRSSLCPLAQRYCRAIVILPFTVDRLSVRPPEPIVPFSRLGPQRPWIVNGQSVEMLPFTVDASTSMFGLSALIATSIEPLTVSNSSSPAQSALPMPTLMDPLTVLARAMPRVWTSTFPFTVSAATRPARPFARTLPFTVLPMKSMLDGTSRRNATFGSLSRAPGLPPLPGLHSLRSRRSGYTAQIVTPPSWRTVSMRTSSALPRRPPDFTAVTRT